MLMLIRVTGPGFVAGLVLDEDNMVRVAAQILQWAVGLSAETLRTELRQRGFTAKLVRAHSPARRSQKAAIEPRRIVQLNALAAAIRPATGETSYGAASSCSICPSLVVHRDGDR